MNTARPVETLDCPTVEEIVEEARRSRQAKLALLVKVSDLAAALGMDRRHTQRTAKALGLPYAYVDNAGAVYLTREDAAKVAERLA
jgi:hypothetical protein